MKNNYCDISTSCEIIKQLKAEVEQLKEQYKWYDHYKESALYNKDLCNKKSWEIGNLGYKIKNQRKEINKLQEQVNKLKAELEPFQDKYFKGLDNITIAELAKKSIRITAENCKLEKTLTEIKEHFDEECKLCKAHYVNITDEICKECEIKDMLQKISE